MIYNLITEEKKEEEKVISLTDTVVRNPIRFIHLKNLDQKINYFLELQKENS